MERLPAPGLPHPHPQLDRRVFVASVSIRPSVQLRHPTGAPLAHPVASAQVLDYLAAARRLQNFFASTSCSIVLSSGSSARTGFVQLGIPTETEWIEGGTGSELREQVEAIKRWYHNDWVALDNVLRS